MVRGLWTQTSRNTSVSPYFMVFGSKAVLLADVAFQAPMVEHYDEENSDQAWHGDINHLEEERLVKYV